MPFRLESPKAHLAFPVLLFLARHVLTRRTPVGRKAMGKIRAHGGPMLRVKREDLAERGVERVGTRLEDVRDGRPVLDGEPRDVAAVVWCTGFQQDFGWIDPPLTTDGQWPREYRGVVADRPGLFFCGLSFQYAFSSMVLPGVDRDACYVATRIAKRSKAVAAERRLEVAAT
jgi:putative flavoprotein involved in K+ transport